MANTSGRANRRKQRPTKKPFGKFDEPPIVHWSAEFENGEKESVKIWQETTQEDGAVIQLRTYRRVPGLGSLDEKCGGRITLGNAAANELKKLLHEKLFIKPGENLVYRNIQGGRGASVQNRTRKELIDLVSQLTDPDTIELWAHQDASWAIRTGLLHNMRMQKLSSAIVQLEAYLHGDERREEKYQEWCEENMWAFGNYYVRREERRDINPGQIVDLLHENIRGYMDIIELKTPQPQVLVPIARKYEKIWAFSRDVTAAIAQCSAYLTRYHNNGGYHPRATIVIGRSDTFDKERWNALHSLNAHMHGISVITFDELVKQARQALDGIKFQMIKLRENCATNEAATSVHVSFDPR